MKNLISVLFLTLSVFCLQAQEKEPSHSTTSSNITPCIMKLENVGDTIFKREQDKNTYDCDHGKMTLDNSLSGYLYQVFDKVVIGNDDVIKNGKAVNISVADKTKLSANYLGKLGKGASFSLGFNATVSNNEIKLVNTEGYFQSGWGFNAKLSFLKGRNSGIFNSENCETLTFARKEFIKKQYSYYKEKLSVDTQNLNTQICTTEYDFHNFKNKIDTLNKIKEFLVIPQNANFYTKKIDSLRNIQRECFRIQAYDEQQLLEDFNNSIESFEGKNASWDGYNINWFDIEASLNTVNKTLLYTNAVDTSKIAQNKIFGKYKIAGNFNHASSKSNQAFYASISLAIQNAYILEGKNPLDTFNFGNIKIVNQEKNTSYYDVTQIPNYDKLQWIFSPSVLLNYFIGKYKKFGFELFSEFLFRNKLQGVEDNRKVVMNSRLGFILNFSEQYKTAIPTIGIFWKLDEYRFKKKVNDYSSIGIRVGIPFDKIFNKK